MFPSTERQRRLLIAWSLLSGAIHILWEGTWSLVAPWLTTTSARHGWWLYWTLYGRADARYVHADPFIRILELVTGTVVAGLNLWAVYALWRRRHPRATTLVVLIVSVMEVYGTIMYFGSEMMNRWGNLDTGSFVHTWLMFFGLNALWLIFPGWCIYEIAVQAVSPERARRRALEPSGPAQPQPVTT